MKTTIYLLAYVVSITSVMGQYDTGEKRIQFYYDVSKKYSPDSYQILMSDDNNKFVQFANEQQSWDGLLANYGTVVHETCHAYNWKIGMQAGWENEGVYITDNVSISFRKGNFFASAVLNTIVPKEQQEKIFRYETYVGGKAENSSALEGIYGFIDEFSAYYHDTKALMEMRPFYETQCHYSDARCWVDKFLTRMQSTTYAYYEFRLFIAWYLLYAEKNESKIFSAFMNNQNLRVAYTLLDDLFNRQVEDYFKIRTDVVNKLMEAGSTIEISEQYLFIVAGFSKSGTGIPDDEILFLKSLFTMKENSMLERFRVKGVTLSNHHSYLEVIKK
jgi:hypothetical protein